MILKRFLTEELKTIKDTDINNKEFRSPSDELLIGLLFQGSSDLETIFENSLKDLKKVDDKIEAAQPKSRLKYFFKGWPPVVWNKYEINLAEFKILSCLNRLNSAKYPSNLLEEKRKKLHSFKKDYSLKERLHVECYDSKEIQNEDTEINGVKIPKELSSTNETTQKCWIIKIKKDEDNYIIEKGCSFAPLAGHGETLRVTRSNDKYKICVLTSWIS